MKNITKHIFVFLFSVLFIWNGTGVNYVVFNCFNCQVKEKVEQSHGCCEGTSCSAYSSEITTSYCEENNLCFPNPFPKDLNSNHAHRNGHCVYIVEYKMDIQSYVSEISVPSIKLISLDLFLPFVFPTNESKVDYYTSFIPPRYSTNTVLSILCVFLI